MSVEDGATVRDNAFAPTPLFDVSKNILAQIPISGDDLARIYIAMEHSGDTVLNCTFGPSVTFDRTERFVFAAARSLLIGQAVGAFVAGAPQSTCLTGYPSASLPSALVGAR